MVTPPLEPYIHEPLRHHRAIRLIELKRDPAWSHGFSLSLQTAHLDDAPPFCALSYTWGSAIVSTFTRETDDGGSDRVMVPITCDGKQLNVTENAVDFLSYAARKGLFQSGNTPASEEIPAIFQLSSEQSTAGGGVIPTHVWIDAICIAQADLAERSNQVAIMGDIYQRSIMTIVWLGKDEPHQGAQTIMKDFIPRFNTIYRREKKRFFLGTDPSCTEPALIERLGANACEHWRNYYPHFFLFVAQRRWFMRGWVVQEVLLKSIENTHDVVVVSGDWTMLWAELLTFLNAMSPTGWRRVISARLHTNPMTKHCDSRISALLSRATSLSSAQTRFKRHYYRGSEDTEEMTTSDAERVYSLLFRALKTIRARSFSDRRDTIYACYGLVSRVLGPSVESLPQPDYNLSDVEVHTRAAWDMIKHLPYLDVLNRLEPPTLRVFEELPSWVPDFGVPSAGATFFAVQNALSHATPFDASGIESPREAFHLTEQNGLVLRGVKVDTIATLGPCLGPRHSSKVHAEGFLKILISMTQVPRESIEESLSRMQVSGEKQVPGEAVEESPSRIQVSKESVEESLCRTLVANIFPPGAAANMSAVPAWWRAWWAELLTNRMANLEQEERGGAAIIMDLVQQLGDRSSWFPSLQELRDIMSDDDSDRPAPTAVDFDPVIHRIYPQRDFFATQDGRFGIGPRSLDKGDEIWLLEGGRTPFILRNNRMIGEAYVHGIMHGEALTPEVAARVGPVTIL